jgi:mono/diheme cytochrome c family protein
MRMARLLILVAVVSAAGIAGCTGFDARRPNVISDRALQNNPHLAEGQRVFMEYCNQCHVGGAAGVGPSLTDKKLPTWLIAFQVRHGVGAMPAFPRRSFSDRQLNDVTAYLRYIRLHPHGAREG